MERKAMGVAKAPAVTDEEIEHDVRQEYDS
jgi:hypothetical protein